MQNFEPMKINPAIPAGEARREAEEAAIANEEQARQRTNVKPAPQPPPEPPGHPDPIVARAIRQAEMRQRDLPEHLRFPFLNEFNFLMALTVRFYSKHEVVPAFNAMRIIDLPGEHDNAIRDKLAALWLDYRRMSLERDKFSEAAITPELEARRRRLLESPATADVVLNVAKETSEIRNEFRERRLAYEEAWLQKNLGNYFGLLAELFPPTLKRIETEITNRMARDRAEAEVYGIPRSDLPPDFTTFALARLYERLFSQLVTAEIHKAAYEEAKRTNGLLRATYFSLDKSLLDLFGVPELPIEPAPKV